jgi:hypothetical protein
MIAPSTTTVRWSASASTSTKPGGGWRAAISASQPRPHKVGPVLARFLAEDRERPAG